MVARLLGCVLLVLVALDVFRTVLLPSARGLLSKAWMVGLWRLATVVPWPRARQVAGPLSIVATVASWVALLWWGFALLYLPSIEAMAYSSGIRFESPDLVHALYLSGVVLTTLGLGDIVPQTSTLRLVVVLQAASGLALFTAALGYLPAIYTVISDLRTSAEAVSDLQVTSTERAVRMLDENPVLTLESVRRDVISARQHLLRFPVLHWFHPPAGQSVLAVVEGATLLWLAARQGFSAERHAAVQRHAAALELALRRLVQDAQGHVGGRVTDAGRDRARELIAEVREAVCRLDPERAAEGDPSGDAVEDLARAHAVMQRYAEVHGYPCPTVV